MGGFSGILPPADPTSFGRLAEETYIPPGQEPVNPLADMLKSKTRPENPYITHMVNGLVVLNDIATIPLTYLSYAGKNKIHVFLNYEENVDSGMNVTSLDVWNNTNHNVNLLTAWIKTEPMRFCSSECCYEPAPENYQINSAGISTLGYHGLGSISPQKHQTVSLLGSTDNPFNYVYQNSMVNIQAHFTRWNSTTGIQQNYGILNLSFRWW